MSVLEILSDRSVIRLGGEDRRSFLQGLVTQDMERLSKEEAVFAALLTPQGKILFDFILFEDGDQFLIDCRRDAAPDLLKRLTLYKLRAKVSFAFDDSLCVAFSLDDSTPPGSRARRDPRLPGLGWRGVVEAKAAVDDGAYDAKRIALGVPEFGKDFGPDETFLLDVNYDALGGVSYDKGCFVGQEVSSRMKRKSAARRRTLIVEFDGPPLDRGQSIMAGETALGAVSSSVAGRALSRIRIDRWERAQVDGAAPSCGGRALRIVVPEYLKRD